MIHTMVASSVPTSSLFSRLRSSSNRLLLSSSALLLKAVKAMGIIYYLLHNLLQHFIPHFPLIRDAPLLLTTICTFMRTDDQIHAPYTCTSK